VPPQVAILRKCPGRPLPVRCAGRQASLPAASAHPPDARGGVSLKRRPPLHGARLPPPLHAPPVHASHANRASAWSSPESSFKETRRSASLCESRLFRFRFKPSELCSSRGKRHVCFHRLPTL